MGNFTNSRLKNIQISLTQAGRKIRQMAMIAAVGAFVSGQAFGQDEAYGQAFGQDEAYGQAFGQDETYGQAFGQDKIYGTPQMMETLGPVAQKIEQWSGQYPVLILSPEDTKTPDQLKQAIIKFGQAFDFQYNAKKIQTLSDFAQIDTAVTVPVSFPPLLGNKQVERAACVIFTGDDKNTALDKISLLTGIEADAMAASPISKRDMDMIDFIHAVEICNNDQSDTYKLFGFKGDTLGNVNLWNEQQIKQATYNRVLEETGAQGVFKSPGLTKWLQRFHAIDAIHSFGQNQHTSKVGMMLNPKGQELDPKVELSLDGYRSMVTHINEAGAANSVASDVGIAVYKQLAKSHNVRWGEIDHDLMWPGVYDFMKTVSFGAVDQLLESDQSSLDKMVQIHKTGLYSFIVEAQAGYILTWQDQLRLAQQEGKEPFATQREVGMISGAVKRLLQDEHFKPGSPQHNLLQMYNEGIAALMPDLPKRSKIDLKPYQLKPSS